MAGSRCGNLTMSAAYEKLACSLPAGVGSNVSVILSTRSEQTNIESLIYKKLGYAAPNLISVQHSNCTSIQNSSTLENCPRLGGGLITINGANFGQTGAVVLIGNGICSSPQHALHSPHSQPIQSRLKSLVPAVHSGFDPSLPHNSPRSSQSTQKLSSCVETLHK